MGYVERHLLPNERVIYKTRLHWVLFARPALVTLLGIALTVAIGVMTRLEWLWYASAIRPDGRPRADTAGGARFRS